MVTAEKLSTSQSLPEPMIVTVSSVDWDVGKSRRAEVELSDQSGTLLELKGYSSYFDGQWASRAVECIV